MSRTGAPPLCRTLVSAAVFLLLCGCGGEAARVSLPSNEPDSSAARVSRLPPANLNTATRLDARPIEPSRAVPAPLTAIPLPSVEDEQQTVFAAAGKKVDSSSEAVAPAAARDAGSLVDGYTMRSLAPAAGDAHSSGDQAASFGVESTALAHRSALSTLLPDFAAAYAVTPQRTVDAADALAPLSGASEPTPQLIAVARQADTHVGRGLKLAERGATYAARAEFTQALRLAAAALDEQRRTRAHSRALANGLRALDEAADFVPAVGASGQPVAAVAAIVRSHRTPIVDAEPEDELLTPSLALGSYLTYAQDQLAAAAGDLQPAASALYALGKLEMTAASAEIGSLPSARAAVYLQAALVVNPQHALAANELGVLLARRGRLPEARAALLHSVRIAPQPAAWRNLAFVHHGLGEADLSKRAEWESQNAGARSPAEPKALAAPAVEWVDPATFAQSTRFNGITPPPNRAGQPAAQASSDPASKAEQSNVSATAWWPWSRTTR